MVAHPREPGDSRSARRLNEPRPVPIAAGTDGIPRAIGSIPIAAVREEWRVVDRWWTEEPVVRRYFELVLEIGENTVVFHDGAGGGGWFTQRGA